MPQRKLLVKGKRNFFDIHVPIPNVQGIFMAFAILYTFIVLEGLAQSLLLKILEPKRNMPSKR